MEAMCFVLEENAHKFIHPNVAYGTRRFPEPGDMSSGLLAKKSKSAGDELAL